MPAIKHLLASEKGILLYGLVALRFPALYLYARALGPKAADIILYITLAILFIECIFVVPPLVPSSHAVIPSRTFFQSGVAVESSISLLSMGLLIFDFIVQETAWKHFVGIALLLLPSVFRWWLHWFFHRLFFSAREPVVQSKVQSRTDAILLEDFEDEDDQGLLAAAYRDINASSMNTGPESAQLLSPKAPNSTPGNSTLGSAFTQLRQSLEGIRPPRTSASLSLRHSTDTTTLLARPGPRTPPHFRHRTTIFSMEILEYFTTTIIVLTLLQLLLTPFCTTPLRTLHLSILTKLILPPIFTLTSLLLLHFYLSHPPFLIPLILSFLASLIIYFIAVLTCRNKCNAMSTTPPLLLLLQGLQILQLVAHIPFMFAPGVVWMARRKCRCCGLASCLVEQASQSAMEEPYFMWRFGRGKGKVV